MTIVPQPGILKIKPYKGGPAHVDGVQHVVKLSSNENPFGPSEDAVEAFRRTAFDLHRYPSTDHASLRQGDCRTIWIGRGPDYLRSWQR